jgi:hypothetical protein
VITRRFCLLFGVVIIGAGVAEPGLVLVVVGTAIVALALQGVGMVGDGRCRPSVAAPTWNWRSFPNRAQLLAGGAAGLSFLAVAVSTER